MTSELLAHIKLMESCRLEAYMDAKDGWTIGWGHLCGPPDSPKPPPITQARADLLLQQDVSGAETWALKLSPVLATEPPRRLSAITDFVYNAGTQNYARSVLRTVVNKRDWPGAAIQMKRWVYDDGKVLPGLVKRRAVCAAWLTHPDDDQPRAA